MSGWDTKESQVFEADTNCLVNVSKIIDYICVYVHVNTYSLQFSSDSSMNYYRLFETHTLKS